MTTLYSRLERTLGTCSVVIFGFELTQVAESCLLTGEFHLVFVLDAESLQSVLFGEGFWEACRYITTETFRRA